MSPEEPPDPASGGRPGRERERPEEAAGGSEPVETVADAGDGEPSIRPRALADLRQGDRVFVNGADVAFRVEDSVVGPNTLPAVYLTCEESGGTFVLEVRECHDLATGETEERVVLVANTPAGNSVEVSVGDATRYGEPVDRLVRRT